MKKKFLDNKVHRGLVFFSVFIPLLFFSMYQAWGADANWVITAEHGDVYDSITYEHYMGGSGSADSSGVLCTTCTGWTDTLTVSDSLYHFYYLYLWGVGESNRSSWGWFKQPNDTTGVPTTITFPLRAYWADSAVSAGTRRWSYNGTGITNNDAVSASTDSNYHFVADYSLSTSQLHNITVDMNLVGTDSSTTWGFQIEPTALKGGSGITLPSSADLVTVYGWLRDASNNPIFGARVFAGRVSSNFGLGGSGPPVIIPSTTVSTKTDSLGLFQLIVRRTGSYSDTTTGFYNFYSTYRGNQMFNIEKLYIPDVDSLSLGDSLGNRL